MPVLVIGQQVLIGVGSSYWRLRCKRFWEWQLLGKVKSLINDIRYCLPFTFGCIISWTHDVMTAFVPGPTAHVQHSAEQVLHYSELRLQLPIISWIMGWSACAVGQTYRKKRQVGDKKNNPRVISKSKFHKVRVSSFTNSKNILLAYLHLIW